MLNLLTHTDQYLLDQTRLCCTNRVVHLHRLKDTELLPVHDAISRRDADTDNRAGKRSGDGHRVAGRSYGGSPCGNYAARFPIR